MTELSEEMMEDEGDEFLGRKIKAKFYMNAREQKFRTINKKNKKRRKKK